VILIVGTVWNVHRRSIALLFGVVGIRNAENARKMRIALDGIGARGRLIGVVYERYAQTRAILMIGVGSRTVLGISVLKMFVNWSIVMAMIVNARKAFIALSMNVFGAVGMRVIAPLRDLTARRKAIV